MTGYIWCKECQTAFWFKGDGECKTCPKCDKPGVVIIPQEAADIASDLNLTVENLQSELSRLREERRWIPVSDISEIDYPCEILVTEEAKFSHWRKLPQPPQECES